MKSLLTLFIVSLTFTLSVRALAWGERGHNSIGYTAARLTETRTTPEERQKLGSYFAVRTYILGHLSNIPDISWKDRRRPSIVELNGPTHYFDVEYVVGAPTPNRKEYLAKIRSIESDLDLFLKTFEDKPNALNQEFNLKVAKDVGSAPFRVAQLYKMMVEAFKCAQQKETKSDRPYVEPIRHSTYICSTETSRAEDLGAAIEIGGVMSHFVGDLAQPYHTTVDHDGYSRGQGGIHGYIETFLVHEYDDHFLAQVRARAEDVKFAKSVFKNQLLVEVKSDAPIAKIMFHLAADSYNQIETMAALDKKNAVLELGDRAKFGAKSNHSFKGAEAKRRPVTDRKVQQALKPFIIDRLATASLVLSELWLRAWREAGSPDVHDAHFLAMPYPLDVPFILPPKNLIGELYDKFLNTK